MQRKCLPFLFFSDPTNSLDYVDYDRGFAAVADPDGYHIQLMSQSIGQDDKLRKQLEALMRTPSSAFTLDSMSMQNRGDGLESITTRDSHNSADALRFAKGGSPVSPSSPVHPSSSPQMYINQQS